MYDYLIQYSDSRPSMHVDPTTPGRRCGNGMHGLEHWTQTLRWTGVDIVGIPEEENG